MPGYDINRFVDLTQNEKNELICIICQDILRCPVVTICCLQSFCDDCINDWLESNNTCPFDRKILTPDQLIRAPRMVVNLLGKLRIRCDFSDNGCNEVMVLEDLSNHLQQCRYVSKECEKCFCKNSEAAHDCVEYLLDTNNKRTIELNELKNTYEKLFETHRNITTELNQLKRNYDNQSLQVMKLKKEKETLQQTIAELKNEVQSRQPSSIKKFRQLFKRDKKAKVKSESFKNSNAESNFSDDDSEAESDDSSNDCLMKSDEPRVQVRALFDCDSRESDELTFKKGDVFEKLMDVENGWCYGRKDGRIGLFPTNYIEVISI